VRSQTRWQLIELRLERLLARAEACVARDRGSRPVGPVRSVRGAHAFERGQRRIFGSGRDRSQQVRRNPSG